MRKITLAAAAFASALALAGCSHNKLAPGVFAHNSPDEFAVGRQAPLVIPPDFALAPPRPGAPRPQEADSPRLQGDPGGKGQVTLPPQIMSDYARG